VIIAGGPLVLWGLSSAVPAALGPNGFVRPNAQRHLLWNALDQEMLPACWVWLYPMYLIFMRLRPCWTPALARWSVLMLINLPTHYLDALYHNFKESPGRSFEAARNGRGQPEARDHLMLLTPDGDNPASPHDPAELHLAWKRRSWTLNLTRPKRPAQPANSRTAIPARKVCLRQTEARPRPWPSADS